MANPEDTKNTPKETQQSTVVEQDTDINLEVNDNSNNSNLDKTDLPENIVPDINDIENKIVIDVPTENLDTQSDSATVKEDTKEVIDEANDAKSKLNKTIQSAKNIASKLQKTVSNILDSSTYTDKYGRRTRYSRYRYRTKTEKHGGIIPIAVGKILKTFKPASNEKPSQNKPDETDEQDSNDVNSVRTSNDKETISALKELIEITQDIRDRTSSITNTLSDINVAFVDRKRKLDSVHAEKKARDEINEKKEHTSSIFSRNRSYYDPYQYRYRSDMEKDGGLLSKIVDLLVSNTKNVIAGIVGGSAVTATGVYLYNKSDDTDIEISKENTQNIYKDTVSPQDVQQVEKTKSVDLFQRIVEHESEQKQNNEEIEQSSQKFLKLIKQDTDTVDETLDSELQKENENAVDIQNNSDNIHTKKLNTDDDKPTELNEVNGTKKENIKQNDVFKHNKEVEKEKPKQDNVKVNKKKIDTISAEKILKKHSVNVTNNTINNISHIKQDKLNDFFVASDNTNAKEFILESSQSYSQLATKSVGEVKELLFNIKQQTKKPKLPTQILTKKTDTTTNAIVVDTSKNIKQKQTTKQNTQVETQRKVGFDVNGKIELLEIPQKYDKKPSIQGPQVFNNKSTSSESVSKEANIEPVRMFSPIAVNRIDYDAFNFF